MDKVSRFWGNCVGLKGLHGFEFPSAAPRPPTVCLTAIFGKIGRKSLNHVLALKSYPVQLIPFIVCLLVNFTGLPSCSLHRPKDTQIHMRRAVVVAACCRRAAIFDQDVVTWHPIRVAVIQGISRAFRRGCREQN